MTIKERMMNLIEISFFIFIGILIGWGARALYDPNSPITVELHSDCKWNLETPYAAFHDCVGRDPLVKEAK